MTIGGGAMKDNMSHFILRILLGLLFVIPGLGKLMNPAMIIGMLGGLGFPAPGFFGWLLLLSEIVFGLAVLVGYKVKWTVWPLVIVLAIAILTVHLKTISDPAGMINVVFHLIGIAGLIVLASGGPGAWAVSKE